jgi:hypothetical protein
MGERRGVYRFLAWKPEGKRPLGRPRTRWEDNIKIGIQEVRCGGMDWAGYRQMSGTCENGNELSGSVKCGEFLN